MVLLLGSLLRFRWIGACLGALVLAAPLCAADSFPSDYYEQPEPPAPNPYAYAWSDARMMSRIGIGMMLGGGATAFTDTAMREVISKTVGGVWTVRASLGTHIPLGVELTYFGSAANIKTPADDYAGMLIGTTFEAVVRYTILPLADGTPYIFGGAGWQRYRVRDAKPPLAELRLNDSDHLAIFPLGAGVSYRDPTGWVADLRGTFRIATDSTLRVQANGQPARLDSWEASAAVGYEF